jgi:hypothetical protein
MPQRESPAPGGAKLVSRVWPQGVEVHDRSLPHRFADSKVPIVELSAVHIALWPHDHIIAPPQH